MGGCCCSARKAHLSATPGYYYCPPIFEERKSLTSHDAAAASVFSSGRLVDLNLETSVLDTYRAPPTPLPYDADFGSRGTYPDSGGVMIRKPVGKPKSTALYLSEMKIELSKLDKEKILDPDEEDVCPICLEEYNIDNPKLITSCEHHFHLSCLLEWLKKSDACPICDKDTQDKVSPAESHIGRETGLWVAYKAGRLASLATTRFPLRARGGRTKPRRWSAL